MASDFKMIFEIDDTSHRPVELDYLPSDQITSGLHPNWAPEHDIHQDGSIHMGFSDDGTLTGEQVRHLRKSTSIFVIDASGQVSATLGTQLGSDHKTTTVTSPDSEVIDARQFAKCIAGAYTGIQQGSISIVSSQNNPHAYALRLMLAWMNDDDLFKLAHQAIRTWHRTLAQENNQPDSEKMLAGALRYFSGQLYDRMDYLRGRINLYDTGITDPSKITVEEMTSVIANTHMTEAQYTQLVKLYFMFAAKQYKRARSKNPSQPLTLDPRDFDCKFFEEDLSPKKNPNTHITYDTSDGNSGGVHSTKQKKAHFDSQGFTHFPIARKLLPRHRSLPSFLSLMTPIVILAALLTDICLVASKLDINHVIALFKVIGVTSTELANFLGALTLTGIIFTVAVFWKRSLDRYLHSPTTERLKVLVVTSGMMGLAFAQGYLGTVTELCLVGAGASPAVALILGTVIICALFSLIVCAAAHYYVTNYNPMVSELSTNREELKNQLDAEKTQSQKPQNSFQRMMSALRSGLELTDPRTHDLKELELYDLHSYVSPRYSSRNTSASDTSSNESPHFVYN